MENKYEIKSWGSKWVIEKNGKIVTLPMSKKDCNNRLLWLHLKGA